MCGAAARHTRAPTQRPRPERPTRSRAARAAGAPRFAAVPRRLQEKTRALGRNVRCARGLHVLRRSRAAPTRARENPVPKDPPSAERRRSVCARVACAFQRHPPSTLRADPAEEVHSAATGCDPGAKDRAARPRRSSPKALPAAPGACAASADGSRARRHAEALLCVPASASAGALGSQRQGRVRAPSSPAGTAPDRPRAPPADLPASRPICSGWRAWQAPARHKR